MRNFLILLAALTAFCASSYAQHGGESAPPQFGAFVGKVLPNGIAPDDEIFSLWGVRYSRALGKSGGYADFGGFFGNSENVKWKSAFATISMHIPVETLIGHAGIGLDITRYGYDINDEQTVGGGHFVGGVMSHLGGNVYVRFDMKLNSKPGTSLFFGAGLLMELGPEGDAGI